MAVFDCAQWKPIHNNYSGQIYSNYGLVLHHAVANGSLWDLFNNPARQASAHFWVSQEGVIEQYVDTDVRAWHGGPLNDHYCGVETEGCVSPPYADPMSNAMVDALSRIYAEGNRRYGWPNALANVNGEHGFGFHRMAMNTACPCDVRLNRRRDILDKAFGLKPAILAAPSGSEDSTVAVITSPGRVDLFVIGNDQRIYQTFADSYNNLLSSPWLVLGSELDRGKTVGAAWTPDYKQLYVTVHGTDDRPYVSMWDGNNWSPFRVQEHGSLWQNV